MSSLVGRRVCSELSAADSDVTPPSDCAAAELSLPNSPWMTVAAGIAWSEFHYSPRPRLTRRCFPFRVLHEELVGLVERPDSYDDIRQSGLEPVALSIGSVHL